ncbi:MAG: 30S ribosomal protein S16 [Flavobacteriales bacterium]|nr:30S ribosomal protein S16 [Flavobacteriales bacterium]
MAVRLRLQRHGKKGKPFYHLVAADARAPRDGRFIEKLGTYNPTTIPATIELNVDSAVKWLQNGAEPTDTVRAILSYKGALYKNHLLNGVKKGALTAEEAETRFQAWLDNKNKKISGHASSVQQKREEERLKKIAAEKEIKEKRLKEAEEAAKAAAADEAVQEGENPSTESEAASAE